MTTHDRRLNRLAVIWAAASDTPNEDARFERLAEELKQPLSQVQARVADLRERCRAAGAITPDQVANVLAAELGLDASAILAEAERRVNGEEQ